VAGDPRIDDASRSAAAILRQAAAGILADRVKLPRRLANPRGLGADPGGRRSTGRYRGQAVPGCRCQGAGLHAGYLGLPQLSVISLLQQFPKDTPINFTCGNSAPKPGVVFAHAVNGALANTAAIPSQCGHLARHRPEPQMTGGTAQALVDWLSPPSRRRRSRPPVVIFGHDSMGMETALAHIIPTAASLASRSPAWI